MSDVLKAFDLHKFKQKISFSTEKCLNYARHGSIQQENIALTVNIPYKYFEHWYDLWQDGKFIDRSYVEILNAFISQNCVEIKVDCERINGILRRYCGEIKSKSKRLRGRVRTEYLSRLKYISVYKMEIARVSEAKEELETAQVVVDTFSKENDFLKERYVELSKELETLQRDKKQTEQELECVRKECKEGLDKNEGLMEYIEKMGIPDECKNTGKSMPDVGKRQQHRKLKELKTNVERSLWFAETYGLTLESLKLSDSAGTDYEIKFKSQVPKKSFKDLPEAEQQKIKEVLLIQDRFCIGEAAYHELTMIPAGEALPRSYLVKQCKDSLNQLCHIERTPGKNEGAQVNFNDALRNAIQKHIRMCTVNGQSPPQKYSIKLSGDGAKMTRLTGFIVISFSILNDGDAAMSPKGNHTVAVIKGKECYETLQSSCSKIFSDVNKIVETGVLKLDEENEVPVDMYLGGDYKFLLLLMGMKGAVSDYACIWCKIHKILRYDMTKPQDFYWMVDIRRSVDDIRQCCLKKQFSCDRPPLLNIPLENVVLDELHLMLRITDKLTNNLVTEALTRDKKENLNKAPSNRTSTHLDNLLNAIRSCGISFNVWEKPDADGRGSGIHDFTSLMGTDKKVLLEKLPFKLEGVIRSDTVIKLWKDFNHIYKECINMKAPTDSDIDTYFAKVTAWVSLFLSLSGTLEGYGKANITPYMHAMVYHVPHFMKIHNGIKQFSGQGVEKLNDSCRRIHLEKSNKWDAAKDVLLAEERLGVLSELERTPRPYQKKADEYWLEEIKESRRKRRRLCDEEEVPNGSEDISLLTPDILRSRLKDLGIITRVRKLSRLLDMYNVALQSQPH